MIPWQENCWFQFHMHWEQGQANSNTAKDYHFFSLAPAGLCYNSPPPHTHTNLSTSALHSLPQHLWDLMFHLLTPCGRQAMYFHNTIIIKYKYIFNKYTYTHVWVVQPDHCSGPSPATIYTILSHVLFRGNTSRPANRESLFCILLAKSLGMTSKRKEGRLSPPPPCKLNQSEQNFLNSGAWVANLAFLWPWAACSGTAKAHSADFVIFKHLTDHKMFCVHYYSCKHLFKPAHI